MPTYVNVGRAPAFGGECEAYVEQALLGHTGVYANPLVALANASDAVRTSDPGSIPAGVAVVFGAAASNEGQGHSGISLGGGRMRSVWSDGSVEEEDIATFASDNGAPLLGWHNFGRGAPSGGGGATGPAAATSGATPGQRLLVGALVAVVGYTAADAVIDALFG